MSNQENNSIHPVEEAGRLDSSLRRLLQNPHKILRPYIKKGMTVLDLGCGPGFFTIEIAKLLNGSGKVIAADIQEGMLEKVRQKIKIKELEKLIIPHRCQHDRIGVTDKFDFILAFYIFHEVLHQGKVIAELKSILKPDGLMLVSEQKFHVPKKSFDLITGILMDHGFEIIDSPRVFFSRTVVLTKVRNYQD